MTETKSEIEESNANPPKWARFLDDGTVSIHGALGGVLTFLLPLVIYYLVGMREPGIHGDYTKFVIVAKTWGIPHATGFPLYIILTGLLYQIALWMPTFRVVLLSVITVALAVHFLFRIGRLLGFTVPLAILIALMAASGRSIWIQACIPDVYGLHILLILIAVWALLKWDATNNAGFFHVSVWAFMLSMANHPTAIFCLPGLLIFAIVRDHQIFLKRQTWLHVLLTVCVVAGLYLYLFIRSGGNPVHDELHANGSFQRLLEYLTAQDVSRDFTFYDSATRKQLWQMFIETGKSNFTLGLWYLIPVGIVFTLVRHVKQMLLIFLVPVIVLIFSFVYHTSEPESFFAIIYLFCALFLGELLTFVFQRLKVGGNTVKWLKLVLYLFFTTAIMLQAGAGLVGYDFSGPNGDYHRAKRIVSAIETPALVYTHNYNHAMLLRYCQYVDGINEGDEIVIRVNWDSDFTDSELEGNRNVYVYSEIVPAVDSEYSFIPVDTGSSEPEIYKAIQTE